MNRPVASVKPVRTYDASKRRDRAARTRDRIVTAAHQRFLANGYAATTVAMIAADAGVSVDTVFKAFGGKPGLVRAIRSRALEGAGPVPAEQRSDALHAVGLTGREIVRAWGALTAEVAPRVAPTLLMIRDAAANDPEVRLLLEELDADRLRRMTENARRLRRSGHVRRGVSLAETADVLWTYSSPELYELLVVRRRWPVEQYGRFVSDAITSALLAD